MSELYRVARVARILDCTRKQVYLLIQKGRLEAVRLGPRQIRITREAIEQLIREGKDPSLFESASRRLDRERDM